MEMKLLYRQIIRSLALDVLGLFANPSVGVHLLNSHLLCLGEQLDSNFFDHQLNVLSKRSTIIPFEEAVELIMRKKIIKQSLIAFSYDDGFEECYTHIVPVLEKYNGYGCFFINPNFINADADYSESFLTEKVHLPSFKKSMNWEQLIDLNERGHIIGAHTMDHQRISLISSKQQEVEYQIGACKKEIEDRLNNHCDYFAFPYGHIERDFGLDAVEIAEQYYRYIFSASNWQNYFSYQGRVFNRRHCEPYWKANHIDYFLSKNINY